MKKLLLPLLLVTPLVAQNFEVGLNLSRQYYQSAFELPGPLHLQPQDKTVVAGRFGYSIVDLGPALFQLTAVYQPKVDTDVKVNAGAGTRGTLGHEYWGVGAMFNFKALMAVGAGIDYRSEKLSSYGFSTTYGRPWARINVGYAFPAPLVKPFFGIEVAAPLVVKKDHTVVFEDREDELKILAPKLQIGIYGGIRF